MKDKQSISKYLVVAGIALAMVVSATAQQMTQGKAKVVRIDGSARYATANNVWQTLQVGAVLSPGAIIKTASDSRVDLMLGEGDQNFVRVLESSVLAIDKLTVVNTGADQISETQLDLREGEIFGNVKKLSGASKYEVKLPNGVAAIRGTIFTLNDKGVVKVLVGSVVIAFVNGSGVVETIVVRAGQQFDPQTGQVTPISDFDRKRMVKEAKKAGVGPNTPPTTFVQDNTTYYVSPVTGKNAK